MEGVDYAYGWTPGLGAKLKTAGKQFACRYLSGGNSKDLSGPERDDLVRAGLTVVVVWETDGKTGPLMGARGGLLDANAAVAQAQSLGIPAGTCIYFAVDFGATSANVPTLQAYFNEARSICHAAGYRCGDYGGLATVTGDDGYVDCVWQTYAWSGGQWDGKANIEQYLNGQSLAGITVDLDRAVTTDFGQFPNQHPQEEPEMFIAQVGTTPAQVLVTGSCIAPLLDGPDSGAIQSAGVKITAQGVSQAQLDAIAKAQHDALVAAMKEALSGLASAPTGSGKLTGTIEIV